MIAILSGCLRAEPPRNVAEGMAARRGEYGVQVVHTPDCTRRAATNVRIASRSVGSGPPARHAATTYSTPDAEEDHDDRCDRGSRATATLTPRRCGPTCGGRRRDPGRGAGPADR